MDDIMDKKLLIVVPFIEHPTVSKPLYDVYYKQYQNYGGKPVDTDWAMELYDYAAEHTYIQLLGKAIGMAGMCDGLAVCNFVVDDRFTRDLTEICGSAGLPVIKL